ncbi:MAG: diguanylate cyclase [Bacteriovoracaceae bacterium]
MGKDDNSTIVITDIHKALSTTEQEASDKPAALIGIGGTVKGEVYDLIEGEINVGRSDDAKIRIDTDGVSRNHFKIIIHDDGTSVTLEDLGSRNGTYVNDDKVNGNLSLRKGDVIKIGSVALKYVPKGDSERATYDKLNEEKNTDGHTKCFNKSYFNKAMDREVNFSKKNGSPLSLAVFDLDHFKKLNDNFGHDAGDYVLKELADIIRDIGLDPSYVFARYGGEEFCILMPKTNLKAGFAFAEKVRRVVEVHKFIYDGNELPVTASIGVSDYRTGIDSGVDLFKRADEAVYKSKENGRNQVNFYRP